MQQLLEIQKQLRAAATTSPENVARFFKTAPDQYGAHDRFLGVTVPVIRKITQQYQAMLLFEIQELLQSAYNEDRLAALIILVNQYQKADQTLKEAIFQMYLSQTAQVNNWNLVDSSAHLIVGAHLFAQDRSLLLQLTQSHNLWERRIAIVATWYFIRQGDLDWTFTIAKILLCDSHDLIHKAVGWMLREAGKQDQKMLRLFLNEYAYMMPRTMLQYAIEKFDKEERAKYLSQ